MGKICSIVAGSAIALAAISFDPILAADKPVAVPYSFGDEGLYSESWFLQSFLDLNDDLAETAKAGKRFAIVWEQRGCPYCVDMHKIDFADPAIASYVKANFSIVELNLFGLRDVTDFDGEVLTEKALARKWGIRATPSIQYFPATAAEVAGRNGREAEIARMPGYYPPETFSAMFRYVRENRTGDSDFLNYLAGLKKTGRSTAAE
jgi:thioredoxin-related protein